jgi:hypothetical protein
VENKYFIEYVQENELLFAKFCMKKTGIGTLTRSTVPAVERVTKLVMFT